MWIKMPKWTILNFSGNNIFIFSLLRIFDELLTCYWQSIIDIVERLCYYAQKWECFLRHDCTTLHCVLLSCFYKQELLEPFVCTVLQKSSLLIICLWSKRPLKVWIECYQNDIKWPRGSLRLPYARHYNLRFVYFYPPFEGKKCFFKEVRINVGLFKTFIIHKQITGIEIFGSLVHTTGSRNCNCFFGCLQLILLICGSCTSCRINRNYKILTDKCILWILQTNLVGKSPFFYVGYSSEYFSMIIPKIDYDCQFCS